MRFPYHLVAVGVLVLSVRFSYSEDLTTLDGEKYVNITDISKYPQQVFFTCSTNRIGVSTTNLPQGFRAKYGIETKTNNSTVSTAKLTLQTNSTDLFLAANRYSDLKVKRETTVFTNNVLYSWTIELDAHGFELISAYTGDSFYQHQMSFALGAESEAQKVFDKFVEWENVASQNNAESFTKPILSLPSAGITGSINFVFEWDKNRLPFAGRHGQAELNADVLGVYDKADVLNFRQLLTNVPALKEELVQALRNQEAQKNLFK